MEKGSRATQPPPPPSLPCQPRQGGGLVSYQRFWRKSGARRPNTGKSQQHTSLRKTIPFEFFRIFESFWGPNMRGARYRLLRVFVRSTAMLLLLVMFFPMFFPNSDLL